MTIESFIIMYFFGLALLFRLVKGAQPRLMIAAIPIAGVAVYLTLALSGAVDYPIFLGRSFVHPMDHKIMQRVFGKDLPPSFEIKKAHLRMEDVMPSPDGPLPALYVVQMNATALPPMLTKRTWKEIVYEEFSSPRTNHALWELDRKRFEEIQQRHYKNLSPQALYFDVYKRTASQHVAYLVMDKQSSPALTLYVETHAPNLRPDPET